MHDSLEQYVDVFDAGEMMLFLSYRTMLYELKHAVTDLEEQRKQYQLPALVGMLRKEEELVVTRARVLRDHTYSRDAKRTAAKIDFGSE